MKITHKWKYPFLPRRLLFLILIPRAPSLSVERQVFFLHFYKRSASEEDTIVKAPKARKGFMYTPREKKTRYIMRLQAENKDHIPAFILSEELRSKTHPTTNRLPWTFPTLLRFPHYHQRQNVVALEKKMHYDWDAKDHS